MSTTNHPSKEQTRIWLQQRQKSRLPPPSPAETRMQLGWKLIGSESKKAA
ncbi:hypothetical protein HSX11_01565 [Oxalobacteraceae bacterium]|nr:hypothetical protein [Oxalobacteraceae bacterium]